MLITLIDDACAAPLSRRLLAAPHDFRPRRFHMKVAAYQALLAPCIANDTLARIRERVQRCERAGVEILCCPEGVLGGLADYSSDPTSIAIEVENGQLLERLAPLASEIVTTIVGFTEIDPEGRLYNSAAIFQRGAVVGVYRKLHPAINRSVYHAGCEMPVFTAGALTFGVIICRDSTFPEPARAMASLGATALFVPTNTGMPAPKGDGRVVAEAKQCDVALTVENGLSVIRADVVGRTPDLISHGATWIMDRDGSVLASARELDDLVIADIVVAPRADVASAPHPRHAR
jgi:5-aminopentanamidase